MPGVTTGFAPDLEKYLKSLKGRPLEASIETLISLLKRRQIRGSEPCAVATAHILLQVVAKSKWHDVNTLLENVGRTGRKLVQAQPNELVIANIVRRVLGLIRDEAAEDRNEGTETPSEAQMTPTDAVPHSSNLAHHWPPSTVAKQDSAGDYLTSVRTPPRPGPVPSLSPASSINVPKSLFHLLSASPPADGDSLMGTPFTGSGTSTPNVRSSMSQVHGLRSEVIDGIEEIKDEISQVDDQIAALAEVQIHPGDYVLLHQPTPTVERFVLRAAQRRKFTVLIATEPPRKEDDLAHAAFRKKLAGLGIPAINIMNGGLMAYMSRVDKVILNAKAVVATGGVVADPGAVAIARAAKDHGNAVIVLCGVYKLSPETCDEKSGIEWGQPSTFVKFADGPLVNGVDIRSAMSEIVPASMVDTYITNLGTHSRDHLSSLIADHYKQEDVDFHLWDQSHW